MRVISLKLREDIFNDAEKVVKKIHVPRNAYINQALSFYNRLNQRRILKRRLHDESRAVYLSSIEVLREFEQFEDENLQ